MPLSDSRPDQACVTVKSTRSSQFSPASTRMCPGASTSMPLVSTLSTCRFCTSSAITTLLPPPRIIQSSPLDQSDLAAAISSARDCGARMPAGSPPTPIVVRARSGRVFMARGEPRLGLCQGRRCRRRLRSGRRAPSWPRRRWCRSCRPLERRRRRRHPRKRA